MSAKFTLLFPTAINNGTNLNLSLTDFEKYIISITTDANYNDSLEYSDAFLGVDLTENTVKNTTMEDRMDENISMSEFATNSINKTASSDLGNDFFNNLYGFIFKDEELSVTPDTAAEAITTSTTIAPTISASRKNATSMSSQIQNNTIPLKLITILNNTKKESPTKVEVPQRKNNKIIDPTDEPLDQNTTSIYTTEAPQMSQNATDNDENLTILRDVLLATLNRPGIAAADISDELIQNSQLFLQRPTNKIPPPFIGSANFPAFTPSNSIESKHNFQKNPIRSELDLIIPELNKNQHSDFSHNNFNTDNYQVLPDVSSISNTESYVVNPVDLEKLKRHQSEGATEIFTPPLKDPAGILKLAGCNIYGRMYRVNRIISELSSPCLECRCTEVGVSCTPLNC